MSEDHEVLLKEGIERLMITSEDHEMSLEEVFKKLTVISEDVSKIFKILQEITGSKYETPTLLNYNDYDQWGKLHEKKPKFDSKLKAFIDSFGGTNDKR